MNNENKRPPRTRNACICAESDGRTAIAAVACNDPDRRPAPMETMLFQAPSGGRNGVEDAVADTIRGLLDAAMDRGWDSVVVELDHGTMSLRAPCRIEQAGVTLSLWQRDDDRPRSPADPVEMRKRAARNAVLGAAAKRLTTRGILSVHAASDAGKTAAGKYPTEAREVLDGLQGLAQRTLDNAINGAANALLLGKVGRAKATLGIDEEFKYNPATHALEYGWEPSARYATIAKGLDPGTRAELERLAYGLSLVPDEG